MAIITGPNTSMLLPLNSTTKKLITGQTLNTTDFSIVGDASAIGKLDVATSRAVDGGVTGENWSNVWFKDTAPNLYRTNVLSSAIVFEDVLEHNKEMEISGYFMSGQTGTEADVALPTAGDWGAFTASNYPPSVQRYCFDLVFENDSSQFNNFSNHGGADKIIADYLDPYDGSASSSIPNSNTHTAAQYSKWTYHIGKGLLPVYDGTNLGVKGGWEYSSGRSDNSYSAAVNLEGVKRERSSRLWVPHNFLTPGSGIARFFRIIVVNKSGTSAKLKLRFNPAGAGNDDVYFSIYDLQTKIYDGGVSGQQQNGIAYANESNHWLASSISGLIGHAPMAAKRISDLEATSAANIRNHINEDNFTIGSGKVADVRNYKIQFVANCSDDAEQAKTFALPLAGLEPEKSIIAVDGSTGAQIGGSLINTSGNETGTEVLGPMPVGGTFKKVLIHHEEGITTGGFGGGGDPNATPLISILKVDFGGIEVGGQYTGGSGVQTALFEMAPTSSDGGAFAFQQHVYDNLNVTFNEGEAFMLTMRTRDNYINDYLGTIACTVVIEFNFQSLL